MNNKLNKIIGVAMLVGLCVATDAAYGAAASSTISPSGISNVISGGVRVTGLTLSTPAATASTLWFYDSGSTNLTYTNGAWTQLTYSTGTGTNYYTNYFGVVTSNTFSTIVTNTSSIAVNTNWWPNVLTVNVPTNSTVVLAGNWTFLNGVTVTNAASGSGSATVNVNY